MEEPTISSQDLLGHLTSGVILVDSKTGDVRTVNKVLLELAGYKRQEDIPQKGKKLHLRDLVTFPKGTSEKGDLVLLNPLLDGYLNTARKEECRVKVKPSELPNNQTLYLVDPYSEEQAVSQAHSDFVSVVSHEFRTPLTSIKGYADTMLRYGKQLQPEQQTRFITIIKDQADRLTRMVENLLTASKVGSGKMELAFRAIDLEKMTDKVIQNILAKGNQDKTYAHREIRLSVSPSTPEIWADTDKLEQILTNLIDNAVKYSFPDSVVDVKALVDPECEDAIVIKITNRGVGIPSEHLPKIFTKFSRIDNPLTRQVEGTGLGLYITKSMVVSMGGRVSVESVPNEETTFTLMFHVATPERQAAFRQSLDESAEGGD